MGKTRSAALKLNRAAKGMQNPQAARRQVFHGIHDQPLTAGSGLKQLTGCRRHQLVGADPRIGTPKTLLTTQRFEHGISHC